MHGRPDPVFSDLNQRRHQTAHGGVATLAK